MAPKKPAALSRKSETALKASLASNKGTIDFLQDDKSEMTYSRQLALFMLEKYEWYFPKSQSIEVNRSAVNSPAEYERQFAERGVYRSKQGYPMSFSTREKPSLEKAWAFRDHTVMSRYLADETVEKPRCFSFSNANQEMTRAEPGENKQPSKLYHPVLTPHKQLGDWGLGMGLYFSTIRGVMVIALVVGIMNIPAMTYYRTLEYKTFWNKTLVDSALLRGSAICQDFPLVPCPTCQVRDQPFDNFVYGVPSGSDPQTSLFESDEDSILFVYRTTCNGATKLQGMISYVSIFIIMIGYIALRMYLRKTEVEFDEDEQTATDYSIEITNPPWDARDPDEWRDFFHINFGAPVTACTVAVDNDLLVKALVRRRELMRRLELAVEPGTSLDMITLAGIAACEERSRNLFDRLLAYVVPGIPEFYSELLVMTGKVQGLAQEDHGASNIFVTFETEADQRRILTLMTVATRDAWQNNTDAVRDTKYLFRGKCVLEVREPEEPDTIRWEDLNAQFKNQIVQQAVTMCLTVVLIIITGVVVVKVRRGGKVSEHAPYFIAAFDAIFSEVIKLLTDFEHHTSETNKQTSLYVKLTVFRLVTYAIIITATTPFVEFLIPEKKGPITQVFTLFWAEIVTSNIMALGDPIGHLQRHIIAPRAKSQEEMNLLMRGMEVNLADLYTNITKLLFLACWYSAVYPAGFLMCALALFINYTRNKFALTRTWERPPKLGVGMAKFGGTIFPPIALVAMSSVSSFFWASFPMDNLCETGQTAGQEFAREYDFYAQTRVEVFGKETELSFLQSQRVDVGDPIYQFCDQNFFNLNKWPFVASKQPEGLEWMSDDQEWVSNIYGWTSLVVILVAAIFLGWKIYWYIGVFFRAKYKPRGEDQGINFSDVPIMSGYVPQVKSAVLPHPLFAVNVDGIDDSILDWTDPDRPYSYYDLTRDAEVLLKDLDVGSNVLFSKIVHWPPKIKSHKRHRGSVRLTL